MRDTFVSFANPGKAEKKGEGGRSMGITSSGEEEEEDWDAIGWIGQDLDL